MSEKNLNLYIEINNSSIIFFAEETCTQNNSKIKYKLDDPTTRFERNKISNFDEIFSTIKKVF